MNCEQARNQLPLLLYGELAFDEEEALEQHIEACPSCRAEAERERVLHELADAALIEPGGFDLAHCRRRLRTAVSQTRKVPLWSRALDWLGLRVAGRPLYTAARLAGAVALLAVGFVGSRYYERSLNGGALAELRSRAEPVTARVRYVEPDPAGGVQIVVDETRQRILTGRLEDDAIQRLLLDAARDPADPGLRAESVDILKNRCDTPEVREALLYALEHDENAGVRLKALEGLKSFGRDPETRRSLARVLLNDTNPGVRTQAIDLLVEQRQPDLAGVLQQLLRKENNSYVRERSQRTLREMNASTEIF
jgi:hypothetical protein